MNFTDRNTGGNTHGYTKSDVKLNRVTIDILSFRVLNKLLAEVPRLKEILLESQSPEESIDLIRGWVMNYFESNPIAFRFYNREISGSEVLGRLDWQDYAAIRIMDYLDYTGRQFTDPNIKVNKTFTNDPIGLLWRAAKNGLGGAKLDYFVDMLHLFRQFAGLGKESVPGVKKIKEWMDRHPTGLDPEIEKLRQGNKARIISLLVEKIDKGELSHPRHTFSPNSSYDKKIQTVQKWWNDHLFHLRFAIRTPQLLNEMLDFSLSFEDMELLKEAQRQGIPIFVNPYYISLLNTKLLGSIAESDRTIRDYIMMNKALIREFGKISAWEKEDLVESGKPNVAGWFLPNYKNVHRRYPEVAILIPDTMGRACGGLCVSCQRMYDFQAGRLNFDLEKMKPKETWSVKLRELMIYFEEDTQLRDILITGGDALMNSDDSLEKLLEEILQMAIRKRKANQERPDGQKYAEMTRVRLGSRLPAYLPMRVTVQLANLLKRFREKAEVHGIRQFVLQTHFQSSMEITPEVLSAVQKLLDAGWMVTNQQVFTTAGSRRGHTAKLRQTLNKIGILPYYTFTVKGYLENSHNFAPNARTVQEQIEEKRLGYLTPEDYVDIGHLTDHPGQLKNQLSLIRGRLNRPFLATDRNVLNLPGVGKSLTFRVVGITRYGKRILEFEHDHTRNHSPIIKKMGKVYIVESKSIHEYLQQLESIGEELAEYHTIWGYSLGQTEPRVPVFDYPSYDFQTTSELTNFHGQSPILTGYK